MGGRHFVAALGLSLALASGSVLAAEGTISTVADLFANKAELAGKEVTVKGKVVKANNNIMQRNWLHLRDGTGGEGTNDITVTSQQTANVGDEVTVRGKLVADKDIGAGYNYSLLIEDAAIETSAGR